MFPTRGGWWGTGIAAKAAWRCRPAGNPKYARPSLPERNRLTRQWLPEPHSLRTPYPGHFEIELLDGSTIKTIGDVEMYLRRLNDEQQLDSHWGVAVRMFANAMREPAYLKAGTMSFQTALALDGLLQRFGSQG